MKKAIEDIGDYMETKKLVFSFLLTGFFLFVSFVGHTRFTTTQFYVGETSHDIYISYYGFPFEMIGILTPIGGTEFYWVYVSGGGLVRILWSGLLLNFLLFFLLSFAIVYLFKRLKG